MVAPNVTVSELDFSTRVPSFPGVYGAICIAANKGPVNDWRLVTSETQLLEQYAVNESVAVGEDNAFFSALAFLEGSNKLWVNRVAKTDSTGPTYPASAVLRKKDPVRPGEGKPNSISLDDLDDLDEHGDITFDFSTYNDATGNFDTTNTVPADQPVFLILAKSPGSWGSNITFTITSNTSEPDESKAFDLRVFNNNIEIESFVCSRKRVKDGYNRSLYIEDVLAASKFITAVDNADVDDEIEPNVNVTTLTPYRDPANPTGPEETLRATEKEGMYSEFSSGSNGTVSVTNGDREREIEKLKNTNNYQVTLLLDGGNTAIEYQKALMAVAAARNDCVAILSVPFEQENTTDYLNGITTYRNTTLNANSSFAAMYSPHLYIYDKFNDRRLYVAPDGYIGAIISRTADRREIWYPPAGFNRGVIGTVLDVRRRYSRGEMDRLYDNQINPIRFAPGRGIVCWGQKTLTKRPSSLDRLNVRLLLIVIEPAIAEALEYFIMEFNDVATRLQVTSLIESYMENIRSRNGVYDFQVTCSEENNSPIDIDNNRMNVWLFVKPTKSVEYIRFNVIITPTGADFSTVADAV